MTSLTCDADALKACDEADEAIPGDNVEDEPIIVDAVEVGADRPADLL